MWKTKGKSLSSTNTNTTVSGQAPQHTQHSHQEELEHIHTAHYKIREAFKPQQTFPAIPRL